MTKKILQLVVVFLIAAQGVMGQEVSIVDLNNAAPGSIDVQVDMYNFDDVSAITLYIGFDSDVLNFTGIADTKLTGSWVANYSAAIDKVIVTYTASGIPTNDIDGKLFDLQFLNSGGFSSDITFDEANCEIAEYPITIIETEYTNGTVTQGDAVLIASLPDLTEPIGNTVDMTVNVAQVVNGVGDTDAFTLKMAYDEAQLAFTGLANTYGILGIVTSAADGVLTISATISSKAPLEDVDLFDVQFAYYGGEADVEFIPGCEFSLDGVIVPMEYTNGSVSPTSPTATLTIEAAGGVPGNAVNVPIVASGFAGIDAPGAVTLNISFDNSKLTYTGYTPHQLSGWVVNANGSGEISMVCTNSAEDAMVDDNLVTLNFNYAATGGLADIMFEPGSILTSASLITIPTTFVDGSVSGNTVSGQLSYNGNAAKGIFPATVYLKDPTTDAIMYSTTTDEDGDYEFEGVANGTYYLDGETTIDATYSYDITDAYYIYYNWAGLTGLQALAGDVDGIDGPDITDAYYVYYSWDDGDNDREITGQWTAHIWIFLNPEIDVSSNKTITNAEFGAITSGDAFGDWTP